MPERDPSKRDTILDAAMLRFARYGFRRTSMEDIAREAGISRAGLYLEFRNKEEIFRSVSAALCEAALNAATESLDREGPLAERLAAALVGKNARLIDLVHGSPHGAELMDENNRLCGSQAAEVESRFLELITRAFRRAVAHRQLVVSKVGLSVPAAAELFVRASSGLKGPGVTTERYRAAVDGFVRVFLAGLTPALAAGKRHPQYRALATRRQRDDH